MLKEKTSSHEEILRKLEGIDINRVLKTESLIDFDNLLTCKIMGYQTPEEYYQKHSSGPYLPQIGIPMLLINSFNDPLIPTQLYDGVIKSSLSNENLIFALIKYGGHLGFMQGIHPQTSPWVDSTVCEYVKAILTNLNKGSFLNEEKKSILYCRHYE